MSQYDNTPGNNAVKLGWFSVKIANIGSLTISSPSTTTIEMSAIEALRLTQWLYSNYELILFLANKPQ